MGNKHMKKMTHKKEMEKIKGSQSTKATPTKKIPSFCDNDLSEKSNKNYPNTISKEFSTSVSFNENVLNVFDYEGE